MENTFKEMCNLLKEGPAKGKENIFLNLLDIILSCTGQTEARKYFSYELVMRLLTLTGSNSPYNSLIYRILINIYSEEDLSETQLLSREVIAHLVNISLGDITNKSSTDADSACMLLSNITRSEHNCKLAFEDVLSSFDVFQRLITAFTTVNYNNTSCSLDQLGMVLCNLSQLKEIRNIMTKENLCILQKLDPFINHHSKIRRRGIIGVVHNCAFDSSLHKWLLGKDIDILPHILLPLAGPEQFDDEDNDKLPIDLQYLPDTKQREHDPEIRKQLLETLNQLCATKFGRQYLRDHNTYIILRELHKWEEDQFTLLACENVVDILIRTEDEIGIDHVKDLEVPKDLEEKFNKVLLS